MGRGRRRDQHRVDVAGREDFLGAGEGPHALGRSDSIGSLAADVEHPGQFRPLVGRDVRGMHDADPAAAEQRDPEHPIPPLKLYSQ